MPKKVKTRKQKIISDSRRKLQASNISEAYSPTYSLPQKKEHSVLPPTPTKAVYEATKTHQVSTTGYHYLTKDLRKTVILTFSIIVAQLLISYLMR